MTPADEALLALEAAWATRPQHDGRKAQAIRDELGLSEVAYYQRLRILAADAQACALHPVTLRLVRERAGRRHGG